MFRKDLFKNALDRNKFQYTNKIWNDTRLNSAWSIGYVSELINSQHFRTKEEWKEFYFHSGEQRYKKIEELKITEDDKNKLFSDDTKNNLPQYIKNLNYKYGRTKTALKHKGRLLYQAILKDGNKLNLTEAECIYAVLFRVLGETWNGIVIREQNTVTVLKNMIKNKGLNIDIRKTEGEFDYKYEVDFEIFVGDTLVCGIQIKPPSYESGNTPELITTKKINKIKNDKYILEFNREVIYIYSNTNGKLVNNDIVREIVEDIEKYI